MIHHNVLKRAALAMAALAPMAAATAQVNAKGALQFALGLGIGGHATHYSAEASYPGFHHKESNRDGAVTVTFPIEAQYGLADRFSMGLYVEPGSYLDSAGTHPNKLFVLGISPRYYLVNKDRFALYFLADAGYSHLRIGDVEDGTKRFDDTFSGVHFRVGAATQWYFGDTFGIHVGLRYAAHNFKWRDRDPHDPGFDQVDYSARLKTSGVQLRFGLQVKI